MSTHRASTAHVKNASRPTPVQKDPSSIMPSGEQCPQPLNDEDEFETDNSYPLRILMSTGEERTIIRPCNLPVGQGFIIVGTKVPTPEG